jgi:hypothetical protein
MKIQLVFQAKVDLELIKTRYKCSNFSELYDAVIYQSLK